MSEPIARFSVDAGEAGTIRSVVDRVAEQIPVVVTNDQIRRFAVLCHALPERLRAALVDFRLGAPSAPIGGFVISDLPFDVADLPPTPATSADIPRGLALSRTDALLLLLASLLGDPFALAGVHDQRLITDLFPVRGLEDTQLGSSSSGELAWHVEDAYSDLRADWLLLMCLRNPEPRVATTFARMTDALAELDPDVIDNLYLQKYSMLPDSSHSGGTGESDPRPVSVLEGRRDAPFVRIDPAFMNAADEETPRRALASVTAAFERNLQDVALAPGDVLVVDNFRAVHGRRSFTARFDGTDRWLRLLYVTANLRRFTGERTGSHHRTLRPTDGTTSRRYS